MTVIAVDDKTVAADGLMCYGNERAARPANKLLKREGRIFGVAGTGIEEVLITWYLDGADPEKAPKVTGDHWWNLLVIETDGRMLFFTSDAPYGQPAKAPFAIGSGADYALGAMKAGASAKRAVEIACELNVYCGGEIVAFDLPQAQREAAE
jgi:ATP-dependent protease HslVU (ClpYQ), peptidase subunit